ncbi:hypothetical protein BCV39_15245 [Vibrio sp. 10N.286.55.E10]|uniref:DUF3080 domain-containing protein n=1 Tax=unclassified Vibrio TaxID=2614977 RepID=UPI000C84CAFB|nr:MULTISPECIES: DUF3080 domain-containing protein [unclassified Vibrio]CAK3863132.1 DUF3080 family protein [Vibrio crassostreae]PME25497.1 hypothetical protein BCV40_19120 [Vibrio sp. 10N.286.55.E12]PME36511.1 hypothetical protein BCV39_15245 [Vibrio sp. 10N.286.55.E10]PME69278.1 hypothetical protein BCV32_10305 [Vibrio sp. 10N.286.55.C11]PMI22631.1 hypothetical protein BCU50_09385 [Vibrio sp. 10N.286.46.E10]
MNHRLLANLLRRSPLVLLTVVLGGCFGEGPGDLFDDYQTKIARVQDADEIKENWEFEALPRKRELLLDIPSLSIGLIDSYQLRQCGLFNLIAERNSVLGKVADEFRNYDYQVALLEGVGQCLANHKLDPEIVELLKEIEQQKLAQFPLHQWNLIYTSDAMQSQMRGSQWLRADISDQVRQTNDALEHINQALNTSLVSGKTIEVQEVLEKSSTLGDLYYSLARASAELDTITKQLTTFDANIICGKQRDTTKFRYLNNVFEQQYIGKVQPYMAQLDGYYQQLASQLVMFDAQPELHSYYFPIKDTHQAFRASTRRHVDYWQQLFKRCGRKVGR